MKSVVPNFNFDGRCAEAIELYCRAFNAKADPVLFGDDGSVYHAEMMIGSQRVMLGDNPDVPFGPGASLSLAVTMDSDEEVRHAFDVLSEGGRVLYPIQSTPYASSFANVFDRFGFRWVLMKEI